jgi:signal transduction histidine kinase
MAAHNLKNKNKEFSGSKHLENIQKKVWEGNRIIDNLLNYSKIKSPSYESCAILSLLNECLSNVSHQFQEYEIKVDKNYKIQQDFTVEVDTNQVREILLNIISNAYQAMSDLNGGAINLTVEAKELEYLKISIKDNGVGIDSADLDKIFLPFFTTKAKGTGLGLTICNEIINLHHGRLDIQSIKGQGTTVDIILPIKQKTSIE